MARAAKLRALKDICEANAAKASPLIATATSSSTRVIPPVRALRLTTLEPGPTEGTRPARPCRPGPLNRHRDLLAANALMIELRTFMLTPLVPVLIIIIVQSISRNECVHLPLAHGMAGSPGQRHGHQSVVIRITLRHRRRGDGDLTCVNQSSVRLSAGGIEIVRETSRDEPIAVDLVPSIEADGLSLFLKDLGGTQVFAR